MRVRDTATGEPLGQPLTGQSAPLSAVALGMVDRRDVIVSGGPDETVRIWDPATGMTLHTADLLNPVRALGVDQGGRLYVASGRAVCAFALISSPNGG